MRLFVAVEPSDALEDWVAASLRAARPLAHGLRWVPPENAHLTLSFLGETPDDRLEPLKEAMRRAAAATSAFTLSFGGLGAFDSWRRVRVVWVGVESGLEALRGLAASLRAELEASGFPIERRDFSAHLTLARSREARPQPALEAARLESSAPMEVAELSLMRSRLGPKGAEYEGLWRCALGR